jgi:hypothetical protein
MTPYYRYLGIETRREGATFYAASRQLAAIWSAMRLTQAGVVTVMTHLFPPRRVTHGSKSSGEHV